ncbi:hypothetical protein L210DRAFT_3648746 [Boletus edulis BED1]|uniref:Uncharacterized protein n=1 Tax=Boletus edulis BED1 TaxID=1328754 RepID=A0AAD4GBT2_BOLED|nr:hypothetical protein L210DRAFT_3648746 [Boletus edulis BED1]
MNPKPISEIVKENASELVSQLSISEFSYWTEYKVTWCEDASTILEEQAIEETF